MRKSILTLLLLSSSVSNAVAISAYDAFLTAAAMYKSESTCGPILQDQNQELKFYSMALIAASVLRRTSDNTWFTPAEREILRLWSTDPSGSRSAERIKDFAFLRYDGPQRLDPEYSHKVLIGYINDEEFVARIARQIRAYYGHFKSGGELPQVPYAPFQLGSQPQLSPGYQFDNIDVVNPNDRPFGTDNGLRSPRRYDRPFGRIINVMTPNGYGLEFRSFDITTNPEDLPAGADNGLRSPRRSHRRP